MNNIELDINSNSELPVFLCYRRTDGSAYSKFIYELLQGQQLEHKPIENSIPNPLINVFFDAELSAVTDWTKHHQPALERSRALIIIITPGIGADTSDRNSVRRQTK